MMNATGWSGGFHYNAKWSGANSRDARAAAANAIVLELTSEQNIERLKKLGKEKHATLVSHSHGGNVAKLVKRQLLALGWTVDMINIETPQRKEYVSEKGKGINLNFFSRFDFIQFGGTFGLYADLSGAYTKDMEGKCGERVDCNAINVELRPYDKINKELKGTVFAAFRLLGKFAEWVNTSFGHSLHNNKDSEKQIIEKTKEVFKN